MLTEEDAKERNVPFWIHLEGSSQVQTGPLQKLSCRAKKETEQRGETALRTLLVSIVPREHL